MRRIQTLGTLHGRNRDDVPPLLELMIVAWDPHTLCNAASTEAALSVARLQHSGLDLALTGAALDPEPGHAPLCADHSQAAVDSCEGDVPNEGLVICRSYRRRL